MRQKNDTAEGTIFAIYQPTPSLMRYHKALHGAQPALLEARQICICEAKTRLRVDVLLWPGLLVIVIVLFRLTPVLRLLCSSAGANSGAFFPDWNFDALLGKDLADVRRFEHARKLFGGINLKLIRV